MFYVQDKKLKEFQYLKNAKKKDAILLVLQHIKHVI